MHAIHEAIRSAAASKATVSTAVRVRGGIGLVFVIWCDEGKPSEGPESGTVKSINSRVSEVSPICIVDIHSFVW